MASYAWKSIKKDFHINKLKHTRGETSMEKNRIRAVTSGKSMRMTYQRQKEVLEMPNLNRGTERFLPVVPGRRTE